MASLLEVGTGFHPELTGRENIYVSGVTLGMTRVEVARHFDEIVEFSGVDTFLDTPVKRYSSGMQVRLGFAVAAHLQSEVLIIDEVLAVGDAEFQEKCLGMMREVANIGRTVLFVSHNIGAVRSLCTRLIWLDSGQVGKTGDVADVVSSYFESAPNLSLNRNKNSLCEIRAARLKNVLGKETTVFRAEEAIRIELIFSFSEPIFNPRFWLTISSQYGPLTCANMNLDGTPTGRISAGPYEVVCVLQPPRLLPQSYTVTIGVRGADGRSELLPSTEICQLQITGTPETLEFHGELAAGLIGKNAPVRIPYSWQLQASIE